MIDLENAFAALPPPTPDARDAERARRVWLRARIAAVVDDEQRRARVQRLRTTSAFTTIIALDAIVPLVVISAAMPLVGTLAALLVTHAAASLALLRR